MCGVAGIYGHPEAANLIYLMLYALNHRGQESTGIATSENEKIKVYKALGLVRDVFSPEIIHEKLSGSLAIGHVRYSTAGESTAINAHPLIAEVNDYTVALGHNGTFPNDRELRNQLKRDGAIFQTKTDSELILHLMARSNKQDPVDKLQDALSKITGSYSIVMIIDGMLIATRDPYGFRPLVMGMLPENGAVVFASETCAFDLIGAEYLREVQPGETVIVKDGEISQLFSSHKQDRLAKCLFEYFYFARPDSNLFGIEVAPFREMLGECLADGDDVEADIVVPIPDSANHIALGYAYSRGIRLKLGIIRNHYVGRTFIEPTQAIRGFGSKIKHNPSRGIVQRQRLIVVEDSIIRGTTSRNRVRQLFEVGGVKEVHFRSAWPRTTHSCFMGIDTPRRQELIASRLTNKEICEFIGATSLRYMEVQDLKTSIGPDWDNYCTACITGNYPIHIPDHLL
jgi:amidophosphoribosyltransferase